MLGGFKGVKRNSQQPNTKAKGPVVSTGPLAFGLDFRFET